MSVHRDSIDDHEGEGETSNAIVESKGAKKKKGGRRKRERVGDQEESIEQGDLDEGLPAGDPARKERASGIIYLQSIPPLFTAKRVRDELSRFGTIGRIFLQVEKRRDLEGKRRKRYVEGWVEFADKKLAKRVAASLNNTAVGGRRRSAARETLWTMKYLAGFKWTHLNEQLTYEQKIDQRRMRAEISQAKRQAAHFADQIEKGENLRKLEEKVLKKGGIWEKYQRQIAQRKTVNTKKGKGEKDDQLMQMIFDQE